MRPPTEVVALAPLAAAVLMPIVTVGAGVAVAGAINRRHKRRACRAAPRRL